MNHVEEILRAVHVASSTIRLQVRPSAEAAFAEPEEGLRLIRAFAAIEDASLRAFLCDVLDALSCAKRNGS